MKIALIGYGKMGQEIEKVIGDAKNHEIVSVSFRKTSDSLDLTGIKKADVAIDFTAPEIIMDNIRQVTGIEVNMVVGTTGWYDKAGEVEELVKKSETGLIYGQNFAIGTNIFFKLVAMASRLTAKYGNYDVYGYEVHHKDKLDSPSGTALKTAKEIMNNFPSKKRLVTDRLDRKIEPDELHFASIRGGRNPGVHEVVFDSEGDSLTISDQNHSRRGYAEGSIVAAEYINGKKGFYNFSDIFEEIK
ncbi:MAG TPA: 4-hydroxy-tetrahydrodipicolinate reductase [Candidatus Saccharimonadales bacterium]|nr:4-hydroxy-tetrahydrodipicolinate reductase [Candidatus Saccharimonadales bacterium]